MTSKYLPEEVISEILWRLPIKSIMRCTSVCKLWYSLIRNPNFISSHIRRKSPSPTNHYFLCTIEDFTNRCSLLIDDENFEELMPLQMPPYSPAHSLRIIGSCNGLICCVTSYYKRSQYGYKVILWNPLIQKSLLLPLPKSVLEKPSYDHSLNFMGFGFDSKTNDYKVLRILYLPESHFKAELYSLNSSSWKDITHIAPNWYAFNENMDPAFSDGALHWIVNSEPRNNRMMVFDMSNEIFREFTLPKCLENAKTLKIKVYGESSVAIIFEQEPYESHIWVMKKKFGEVSEWVKLGEVGKQGTGDVRVLGFRINGEVLFEYGCYGRKKLASQKLKSGCTNSTMTLSQGFAFQFGIHNYVESMALFDKGNHEARSSGLNDAKRLKICG